MEIFLVSNNLLENRISYLTKDDIEKKKMTRPLSVEGERLAKEIALYEEFNDISVIYSSLSSSSIGCAKYLADRCDKSIIIDEALNDQKIGNLNGKSIKMIRFMQDHDFDISLDDGESLANVRNRLMNFIKKVFYLNLDSKVIIFTHKRVILSLLLNFCKVGYNLDDELILEYEDKMVFSEDERDLNLVKLNYDGSKVYDINSIDLGE